MPANVYDQHRASFAHVSAYVIARQGKQIGTIAFKFPRDGAGRLLAYVHFHGAPMVRGYAGGFGYDKRSAACANAAQKMTLANGVYPNGEPHFSPEEEAIYDAFKNAIAHDGGSTWENCLRDAGFNVWGAV